MKISVKDRIRHYLNPVHVYCSLTSLVKKGKALKTAKLYERFFFNTLLL